MFNGYSFAVCHSLHCELVCSLVSHDCCILFRMHPLCATDVRFFIHLVPHCIALPLLCLHQICSSLFDGYVATARYPNCSLCDGAYIHACGNVFFAILSYFSDCGCHAMLSLLKVRACYDDAWYLGAHVSLSSLFLPATA